MLKTRVLTACVLGLMLLAGLFLMPPWAAATAFGAVFAIGAWEWAGFGGLGGALARARLYAGIVLLLILAWRLTEKSASSARAAHGGLRLVGDRVRLGLHRAGTPIAAR